MYFALYMNITSLRETRSKFERTAAAHQPNIKHNFEEIIENEPTNYRNIPPHTHLYKYLIS